MEQHGTARSIFALSVMKQLVEDTLGDGDIIRARVRIKRDEPVDIMKSARRLCRAGTAFAGLDIPLKIQ